HEPQQGTGPFPAIVFNHGSEELVGSGGLVAKFYTDHGYVVFFPHRRGHGRSRKAAPYMNHLFDPGVPEDPQKLTAELVAQSDDVMAAVDYVASLPEVDPKRIAVIGCSFGGIETLFAAERGTNLTAAVDFAGAAMSWAENPPLRARMLQAARNAQVPVFFIQAENDFDTTPSKVLSEEMKRADKPMQVHIFPPYGTTHRDGHSFCGGVDGHPAWGDEVLTFLAENMPIVP
ncbi:MAG TPA: alpha/beta fold hydrolase, partial [Kofleriaceae bacterium]